MKEVADEREGEEGQGAEGKDGGDCRGGVLLVGVDGGLCSHDGGDAADGTADGEQARELGRKAEDFSEDGHHGEREGKLDGDEDQAHAANVEDVREDELGGD